MPHHLLMASSFPKHLHGTELHTCLKYEVPSINGIAYIDTYVTERNMTTNCSIKAKKHGYTCLKYEIIRPNNEVSTDGEKKKYGSQFQDIGHRNLIYS